VRPDGVKGTDPYSRCPRSQSAAGIGRPPGQKSGASYVLENFSKAERPEVPVICEQAADAVELLIAQGLEPAQNTVHAWG